MSSTAARTVYEPTLRPPFGGPQVLVLDTGVLYDDIVYRLRNPGRRGVLIATAQAGATTLIAADHIYREVYDSLTGHDRRGVTREDVIACFERVYLPYLRFVTMPSGPIAPRLHQVASADPDDAPTAGLALLVAPAIVCAQDSDLVDAGFGRPDDWLRLAFEADALLGYDGALWLCALGGRALLGRTAQATRWFARDLRTMEVAAGAAIGIALSLTAPQVTAKVTKVAQAAGHLAVEAATETAAGVTQLVVARSDSNERLHTAAVEPDLPRSLTQQLARPLALSRRPLPTGRLAAMVGATPSDVAAALDSHSAFVRVGDDAWQLGRLRQPRARAEGADAASPLPLVSR